MDEKNLIKVIASVPAGTFTGKDGQERQLWKTVCLIGEQVADQYSVEQFDNGLYIAYPRIKFFKVVDDNGQVRNRPIMIARIGEKLK